MTLNQAKAIRTRQLQGQPVGAELLATAIETIQATQPVFVPKRVATPYERTAAVTARGDLVTIRRLERANRGEEC